MKKDDKRTLKNGSYMIRKYVGTDRFSVVCRKGNHFYGGDIDLDFLLRKFPYFLYENEIFGTIDPQPDEKGG